MLPAPLAHSSWAPAPVSLGLLGLISALPCIAVFCLFSSDRQQALQSSHFKKNSFLCLLLQNIVCSPLSDGGFLILSVRIKVNDFSRKSEQALALQKTLIVKMLENMF